ncbi:hypothetical protein WOLCODRAFT_16170 [Wolfiporia cocos MD-104 SS10]|uniref:Uncharacterized protein n=1 Tax=Wolfiporia cocos (strain MD-104) TaxID=742152 RepID=A0A2H3JC71_WOLCO|nr:hypothetical protein WOLCODRAFT_16170 [Wolfiporia cocos MD-104 SS10]
MYRFYGFTTVQAYAYFRDNVRDSPFMKVLVGMIGFLWALDTLDTALIAYTGYKYAVIDFAKPEALLNVLWHVVGARGAHVSKSLVLSGVIILGSLITFACGTAFGIKELITHSFSAARELSFSVFLYTGLSFMVASDMLTAVSLCALLYKHRTGFIKNSFQYAAMNNYVYIALYWIINKATLNARDSLREKGGIALLPLSRLPRSSGAADDASVNNIDPQSGQNFDDASADKHVGPMIA